MQTPLLSFNVYLRYSVISIQSVVLGVLTTCSRYAPVFRCTCYPFFSVEVIRHYVHCLCFGWHPQPTHIFLISSLVWVLDLIGCTTKQLCYPYLSLLSWGGRGQSYLDAHRVVYALRRQVPY